MQEIKITRAQTLKEKPESSTLVFGKSMTDHMFIVDYDAGQGWHDPRIVPYAPLQIDPAAKVLHYAQEIFEGLKAYRTDDGSIQLFRPMDNIRRMNDSAERISLPQIPEDLALAGITELVKLERDWVPHEKDTSLYIRPFVIATDPFLGVRPSDTYLFIIILSPSGAYYEEGLDPVNIYVEDEYVRATPGGTGYIKCGGNYAASIIASEKAHKLGFAQVLWLDGVERKYVEEVGSMNIMFKVDGEIYTAPTVGTVLPGITRMSCIELLKKWGYKVHEERFTIDFIMDAAKTGKLEEVFGTGTAAVISPVGGLTYEGDSEVINNGEIGEVTQKLYDTLTGIQFGKQADDMGWIVPVSYTHLTLPTILLV